jgi:hypothetical protein
MANKQTMGKGKRREWLNWIIDTTREGRKRKGDLAHQQQWRRGNGGFRVGRYGASSFGQQLTGKKSPWELTRMGWRGWKSHRGCAKMKYGQGGKNKRGGREVFFLGKMKLENIKWKHVK